MPAENSLTVRNSVDSDDKIRVVTKDGLSQSIEVDDLKNSLSVADLPSRVSTLETKANDNETDHIDMVSRLDALELTVGEEEVEGETVTNSGLFKKISKVRSDLSDLHLEEVNRLDGELIDIRADLTSINGTNGRLEVLEGSVEDLVNNKLDVLTFQSVVDAGFKVINKTPASATDTGTAGEVCWDTTYLYVCVGTNTWKRIPFPAWT